MVQADQAEGAKRLETTRRAGHNRVASGMRDPMGGPLESIDCALVTTTERNEAPSWGLLLKITWPAVLVDRYRNRTEGKLGLYRAKDTSAFCLTACVQLYYPIPERRRVREPAPQGLEDDVLGRSRARHSSESAGHKLHI